MNKEINKKNSAWQRFLNFLDGEKTSKIAIPMLTIVLSLVVASIMLLCLGKNPFAAFVSFLRGCGILPKPAYAGGQNMLTDFLSFLGILAPMLLASLGIIVAMKTGLFNIGIAGQMLISGFIATVFVGYSNLDAWLAKPLVIIIGIVVGGLVGALIGFLKYRFNIHEVVTSIMLNYIINYVVGFFINTKYVDQVTRQSKIVSLNARLNFPAITTSNNINIVIPMGFFLAIIGVFIVRFIMDRTVFGFELKAVGQNRNCAKYAGIKVGKNIVSAMMLSGVFAGLAGVTYYLGYFNAIVPKSLAGLGYDSIAVALLGNISPLGAIFSSFLITIFQNGSVYMSSNVGVPKEIASVITGILLLFSACGTFVREAAHRARENDKMKKNAASAQKNDAEKNDADKIKEETK